MPSTCGAARRRRRQLAAYLIKMRWVKFSSVVCNGFCAIRGKKTLECINPKHKNVAFKLNVVYQVDTKSFNLFIKQKNPGIYNNFTMPLVRKMYPTLSAQSLVSVQPLNTPVSMQFFWRWDNTNIILTADGQYYTLDRHIRLLKRVWPTNASIKLVKDAINAYVNQIS